MKTLPLFILLLSGIQPANAHSRLGELCGGYLKSSGTLIARATAIKANRTSLGTKIRRFERRLYPDFAFVQIERLRAELSRLLPAGFHGDLPIHAFTGTGPNETGADPKIAARTQALLLEILEITREVDGDASDEVAMIDMTLSLLHGSVGGPGSLRYAQDAFEMMAKGTNRNKAILHLHYIRELLRAAKIADGARRNFFLDEAEKENQNLIGYYSTSTLSQRNKAWLYVNTLFVRHESQRLRADDKDQALASGEEILFTVRARADLLPKLLEEKESGVLFKLTEDLRAAYLEKQMKAKPPEQILFSRRSILFTSLKRSLQKGMDREAFERALIDMRY